MSELDMARILKRVNTLESTVAKQSEQIAALLRMMDVVTFNSDGEIWSKWSTDRRDLNKKYGN